MTELSRPRLLLLTLLLGMLSMIGPFGVDVFLPGIPKIADGLGTTTNAVAISISSLMLGNAAGQLFHGPLSDRFGRRPVILGVLALYAVAAAGSALASSVEVLIAWRFIQGTAQSGGRMLAAAVARDMFERERLGKMLSDVMFLMSLGAILGPVIGGQAAQHLSWPWPFWFMAGFAVIVFVLYFFFFQETLARKDPMALAPSILLSNFLAVIRDATFLKYVACSSFLIAGLIAYISASSAVMIGGFGLEPSVYGYLFAAVNICLLLGTMLSGRLVMRLGLNNSIMLGAILVVASGVGMAVLAYADIARPLAVVAPMTVYMFGVAFAWPQSNAAALQPFPTMAGTASSVMGIINAVVASGCSIAVSTFDHGDATAMASTIAFFALLTAAVYFFWIRTAAKA